MRQWTCSLDFPQSPAAPGWLVVPGTCRAGVATGAKRGNNSTKVSSRRPGSSPRAAIRTRRGRCSGRQWPCLRGRTTRTRWQARTRGSPMAAFCANTANLSAAASCSPKHGQRPHAICGRDRLRWRRSKATTPTDAQRATASSQRIGNAENAGVIFSHTRRVSVPTSPLVGEVDARPLSAIHGLRGTRAPAHRSAAGEGMAP